MNPREVRALQRAHEKAMSLCDEALLARRRKDDERAADLFAEAFESESEAAGIAALAQDFEPTRSVLHRSAAALAMECGLLRQAEQIIGRALAGNPPAEIAEELRDLLEKVNFGRHLELRGVAIAPDEFQISIYGNATSHGMAQADQFVGRVQTSEKLVFRTIERKLNRPFREAGRATKEVTGNFELYLSVPRAASFAVTLRVGRPEKQLFLPSVEPEIIYDPAKVIDDLFECLAAFEERSERLDELIPEAAYRRNFVALAQKLGPDGDRIKFVGLTAVRYGQQKTVQLVRPPSRSVEERLKDVETVTFSGELLFANAATETNTIRIVKNRKIKASIVVPEGIMADIVKPLWGEQVKVTATRKGRTLYLDHIEGLTDQTEEDTD
jgi:hypothetical protein